MEDVWDHSVAGGRTHTWVVCCVVRAIVSALTLFLAYAIHLPSHTHARCAVTMRGPEVTLANYSELGIGVT